MNHNPLCRVLIFVTVIILLLGLSACGTAATVESEDPTMSEPLVSDQ